MSLREVSSSTPFLAKKGGAAPANPGVARGGPAGPSLRPIESNGEILLESAPAEAPAGIAASAAGKQAAETAPAASLLPFDLMRKKYRPDAVPDLVEDEPDIAPLDFAVISELKPEPRQQAELALRIKPEVAPESDPYPTTDAKPALELKAPRLSEPEADPRLDAPALAPGPKPEWRVDVEMPAQSQQKSTSGGWLLPLGALAAAFAALVVGWNMTNPGFDLSTWLTSEPAVTSESTSESAGEIAAPVAVEPPPPIAESPEVVASPAPVEPEAPAAPESLALPESPAQQESPVANPVANPVAVEPETTAPTSLQANLPEPVLSPTAGSTSADGAGTPASVETPLKPTVDVVRLEANGDAVIAGRAAPNSELIVLDNGEPIGTVQADAFGEWVFVPEAALPIGDHEFGLVVKTVQESVSLPAPSKPSLPPAPTLTPDPEPALAAPELAPVVPALDTTAPDIESNVAPDVTPAVGGDEAVTQPIPAPVPVRKPDPTDVSTVPADVPAADVQMADAQAEPPATSQGPAVSQEGVSATNTPDFVVQLASVKTRAGAEQEWRKLKQKFPEILSDMVPALDEVKLVDYGTVIRVRTGAFDSQRDAATLCAQLAEKRQACLVVKTSGGN